MIEAIIILVIFGVVLYLVENYIPMSPPIKVVVKIVIVLLLCFWLLDFFGIYHYHKLGR